jgi:ferredoxin-type protein NapF
MNKVRLKNIRVAVSLAILIGLTLALVGLPGSAKVGNWLATLQFIPSLLALTAGVSLSLACVVIVALTLLAGRIYCSFICPLGALQDVIARISSRYKGKCKKLTYTKPVPHIRATIFLLTVVGVVSGWAGLVLSLLDPYSNFGRIVSSLLRPLFGFFVQAIPGIAKAKETAGAYPSALHWGGLGALAVPIIVLGVVGVLAALRGRLYCNTLCPVGTLLGFISKHAAFQLQIDDGCLKCLKCVRVCKAQCIDPRSGSIDASRCVSCYNCIPECKGKFIGHRLTWGTKSDLSADKGATLAATNHGEPLVATNFQRRAVMTSGALALVGAVGSELLWANDNKATGQGGDRDRKPSDLNVLQDRAVRPPGSTSLDRFLSHCTACQLCVSTCPTHVLTPSSLLDGVSGYMKPQLNFAASYCDYNCNRCGQVCPSGALDALGLLAKQRTRIGLARLDASRCIVQAKQTACTRCIDHCPTKAIDTVAIGGNLRLPHVKALLCVGCGRCEHECPVDGRKAISVFGLLRETHIPTVVFSEKSGLRSDN